MKLILKRIERRASPPPSRIERNLPDMKEQGGPFALHTEDGEVLPCQVRTTMTSATGWEPVELTVVFRVDGKQLTVVGDQKA
ncbi:hypothetical protein [Pseudomonas sp. Marseille-Q5115]|uniref:hypothetical protein n=1 Tax=Pseudomonas sp. Marseille-Q5115 TaxID=2866593 RepID=UPI001CE442CD|nr:hypothetical protein [Pseudomonas sp. Marseille-Q5115]